MNDLNIGAAPDDGTGDSLRDAGQKINDNFAEVSNAVSALNAAVDLVSDAVSNEISNRVSADDALSNAISAVGDRVNTVSNAASAVSHAVSVETLARIGGDSIYSGTQDDGPDDVPGGRSISAASSSTWEAEPQARWWALQADS